MKSTQRNMIILAIAVVVAFVGFRVLTMPDRRTPTEKVGDAIHDLPQGWDKASRQLEDRTLGDKIGDSIKDTTGSRR